MYWTSFYQRRWVNKTPFNYKIMFLTLLNALLIIGVLYYYEFSFNITDSLPVGVYRLVDTRLTKGSIVAFCLDDKSSDFLRKRGGIPVNNGRCGDYPYLLKKIYGVPGDYVSQGKSVFVNRVKIPGVVINRNEDFEKTFGPLTTNYRLMEGQYLLISAEHPDSFDSRYFGPVNRDKIYHGAVPIWTF